MIEHKDNEKPIDFIKRRFVTADNTIVFDEQFENYLTTLLNKLATPTVKSGCDERWVLLLDFYDYLSARYDKGSAFTIDNIVNFLNQQ